VRLPSVKTTPESASPRVLLGRQLGRHTAIYLAGTAGALPIFLVNAVVLTHFLVPAVYGHLGVLTVTASLMSVVENLVTLPGTFAYAYRTTGGGDGDDELDDDADLDEEEFRVRGPDPRRVVATGFATMGLAIVAISAAPILFAGTVADWLIGDSRAGSAIIWMVAAAAAGALWRMVGKFPRIERRPMLYAGMHIGRALLVLGVTGALVASGNGITGALAGLTLGTLLPALAGLVIFRGAFTPALSGSDLRGIYRIGRRSVVMHLAMMVTVTADILLLSRVVSAADVGLYRLATRFGGIAGYLSSAFMLAWAPLRRTSVYRAALDVGAEQTKSRIVTYYVLACLTLIVVLGVAADGLVQLAPPAYEDAAPLVPIIGLAAVARGGLRVLNRTARFRRRRRWYQGTVIGGAVLAVLLNLLLIPLLGSYGAALSVLLTPLLGCAVLAIKARRSPTPVPFETRRITIVVLLAALSLLIAWRGDVWTNLPPPLFDLLALACFAIGVVVFGALPRGELRPLGSVLRSALPGRRKAATVRRLAALPTADRHLLTLLLHHRWAAERIGEALDIPAETVQRRAVAALRRAGGVAGSTAHDAELAAFLFSDKWLGERDAIARALWEHSDVVALHRLELVVEDVRKLPERRWVALNGR
jgi:O-antigen/teichoic acid export membrane protein